jgi:hypothetical protein
MRARLAVSASVLSFALTLGFPAEAQQTTSQESAKPEAAKQEAAPSTEKQLTPAAALAEKPVTQEQLQALVQKAVTNDLENYEAYKNLTHIERVQTEHMDSKDKVKKTETVTKEVFILYGERVEHVIERDDKPLSGDEAKKEQDRFDKEVQKLKDESEDKRRKREEKFEEETKKDRESIADAAAAFNFKLLGEEMVNGRPAYVIQGEQKPDYKPKTKAGDILRKVHGKIWIDIAATHWVKLDVEFTDTYSFGWVLARVRPGTRVQVEQVLFRDDVWVPREVTFKLDARVALFKQMFENVDVHYRDWRRFGSESRITGFTEIEPAKQSSPTPPPQ